MPSDRDDLLDQQKAYYAQRRPVRIQALDTAYIHRHYAEAVRASGLRAGHSVCEWGAGLGRFSRLLLADGIEVSAIELSPQLAAEAGQALRDEAGCSVHCGDVAEVLPRLGQRFDAMLGFFVLHHLPQLQDYFTAARQALRPGGCMVFVEPNPYHPLYPVQIACTPGMRWHAERGIYELTPRTLRLAAQAAGFSSLSIERYGALPRAPYNWAARWHAERLPERIVPAWIKPFQIILARP